MMELGQFSSSEHERIGALVPKCADMLLTLGVRSRKIAEGALEHGLSEKVIWQYDDVGRAGRELQNLLEPGDVVLVKASQSIRAEKVVEEIMAEPERAEQLLVRQDSSWKVR
jgi:UDP-N-acetylmuramyl pentapeptide synthase